VLVEFYTISKKPIVIGKSIFWVFLLSLFQNLGIFPQTSLNFRSSFIFPSAFSKHNSASVKHLRQPQSKLNPCVCLRHNSSLSGSREIQHALFRQCCQVLLSSFVCSWLSCTGMQIISFGAAAVYSHTPHASDVLKGSSSCICVVCVEA